MFYTNIIKVNIYFVVFWQSPTLIYLKINNFLLQTDSLPVNRYHIFSNFCNFAET